MPQKKSGQSRLLLTHSPTGNDWERLPWTWKRGTGVSKCACLWNWGNLKVRQTGYGTNQQSRHLPLSRKIQFWAMLSRAWRKLGVTAILWLARMQP